jgi:hypothetical protein
MREAERITYVREDELAAAGSLGYGDLLEDPSRAQRMRILYARNDSPELTRCPQSDHRSNSPS